MKQNLSYDKYYPSQHNRKHLTLNMKIQEHSHHHQLQKPSDLILFKKQLEHITKSNELKQNTLSSLEKQLMFIELEQKKLQAHILKHQLELENVKFQNLQKRHQYEEEKQQQEQQNQMDMNSWLNQVQKYNGLPQSAIDSLISMEYQGNPLDSDICLSCYKEMQTGQMAKYLPCAHLFHVKCVDEHLKLSKVCPACMEEVVI